MQRKFLLALVLCLVAVAALATGAAPALATDGCDCHTAVPPTSGAPAAHAPFVAGVSDCTTCHVGWTVPHPDAARESFVSLQGRASDASYKLSGRVGFASPMVFIGHPDVVVYLQQRPWGATEFTDLTQVTTRAKGGFAFTVASPPPFATYRAIAQGHVFTPSGGGTSLFMPKEATLLPTPELGLEIRGLVPGHPISPTAKLGRTLTVHGAVAPADLGGKVTIRVHKARAADGKWVTRITVRRAIGDTGTYSWKWAPRHRGYYRVDARIPATAAHRGAVTRFAGGVQVSVY
jgi:hypothetical protein